MTSAYTNLIESGQVHTGAEFIMACAKEFGPCASLRFRPLTAPLSNEIPADTTALEAELQKAWGESAELDQMTLEQAQERLDEENQLRRKFQEAEQAEALRVNDLYDAIYKQIVDWQPPTAEHEALRAFALDQIQQGYRDMALYSRPIYDENRTAQEWLDRRREQCNAKIARYSSEIEDVRRTATARSRWIQALRRSLESSMPLPEDGK